MMCVSSDVCVVLCTKVYVTLYIWRGVIGAMVVTDSIELLGDRVNVRATYGYG
jgi:hypothetical protein